MAVTLKLNEYMIKVSEYMKEVELKAEPALIYMIINVLQNSPGFIPEYPMIGVGLSDNYLHLLEDDEAYKSGIRDKVRAQMLILFPDLSIDVTTKVKTDTLSNKLYMYMEIVIKGFDLTIATTVTKEDGISIAVKHKDYNI